LLVYMENIMLLCIRLLLINDVLIIRKLQIINQKNKSMQVLTAHRKSMADRNAKIYDMYNQLVDRNVLKTAAMDAVKAKYGIYTYNTIYKILRQEALRRETT